MAGFHASPYGVSNRHDDVLASDPSASKDQPFGTRSNELLPKQSSRHAVGEVDSSLGMKPTAYEPTLSSGAALTGAGPRDFNPVAASSRSNRTSGAPGARQFDGSQNPSMEIQKRAPSEVQVGMPATFSLIVRNVGNATAFDVQVMDMVPRGVKLVRTAPEAQRQGPDGLVWGLGEMAAGQEATLNIELVPETEGEIGSVASVTFAAQASVRTISTQPKLQVKQVIQSEVLGGESSTIVIEVSNVGSGTARNVQLQEDVPAILRHASGAASLDKSIGDLAPGDSERVELVLTAVSAGKAANVVRAVSENAATHESSAPIEVKSPKLQIQITGPRLRYLDRPAPYEAIIENVGTAVARDLNITVYLPQGMNFNSATNEGTYLPDQHAVAWNLAELAAGTKAKAEMTLLPVEEGKSILRMVCEADGVRAEPHEREVSVEGQSELVFDIEDDNDPIETDETTTYSIRISNIGTRPDAEIQLAVDIPDGAVVEQVHGPVKYQAAGRSLQFAPIPQLRSKDQVTVRFSVRHSREGTHIVRASLRSQLRPTPVVRDESTQVYRDQ
jgi:uncharacterized repeat protein (TIGR01451 family)